MPPNSLLRFVTIVSLSSLSAAGLLPQPVGTKVERASEAVDYNAKAQHYVSLRQVSIGREEGSSIVPRIVAPSGPEAPPKLHGTTEVRNNDDVLYIVDLEVGAQSIPVSLDTGSSDTWFIQEPFSCVGMIPGNRPVRILTRAPSILRSKPFLTRLKRSKSAGSALASKAIFPVAPCPANHSADHMAMVHSSMATSDTRM